MIALAEPSRLIILIPADLDDGEYTLTVTTQYKETSNDYFKTPRSTSQTIYVGGAPQTPGTGGAGGGGGTGEGEEGSFG